LLELGLEVLRVRRDVRDEEALLAERVVELARSPDEDVRLGVVLLRGDARLEVAGRRERKDVDLHPGRRGEGLEQLVVRRFVQRRVDRDPPGWLRGGGRRRRAAAGRGRWRRRGRARSASACREDGGHAGELQELASVELWCHSNPSHVRCRRYYARDRAPD